jgi:hypothetical protein
MMISETNLEHARTSIKKVVRQLEDNDHPPSWGALPGGNHFTDEEIINELKFLLDWVLVPQSDVASAASNPGPAP